MLLKEKLIKFISISTAAVFLSGVLISCKKEKGNQETSSAVVTSGEITLDSVQFNNEEFNVLYWSDSGINEYVDDFDKAVKGGIVDEQVYYRNLNTTEKLKLSPVFTGIKGDGVNPSFVTTVRNAHQSGSAYDLYISYSCYAGTLAAEGMLTDLRALKYMDFDKPWYPKYMVEDCSIKGRNYFCTGDVSTNLGFMVNLIYFNKSIYSENQLDKTISSKYGSESIYKLVEEGKWTYSVLMELSKKIYADMDRDGFMSAEDKYGFGVYDTVLDNFYYGAGLKTLEYKPSEGIVISDDFKNIGLISQILNSVGNFITNSGNGYTFASVAASREAFSTGRILFDMAPASHAYKVFRSVEGLEYGVLPIPKYSEEQEMYSSAISQPYSMYSISSISSKKDESSAYLQMLGQYSYSTTRPAIYEQTLKTKYSADAIDSVMWDYIIDSQVFDLGRIYARRMGSSESEQLTVTLFRNKLMSNNGDWASAIAANGKVLEGYVKLLNENLMALE